MESPSPALILASRRRALTGSSRSLSRAYNKGELVRVRTGVYYSKPAWLDDELLGGRSTREVVLAEKKREDRLRALGYTVVRWDWNAVTDPEVLRRKLEAAGVTRHKSPPHGLIPLA
jgi:hypothetical protein